MNDHLGTPQKLIQASGAVVWSAKYRAFGLASVDAGSSWPNPLRFAGQYADGETGSHYNYFRDYGPELGRYLQSDPIGLLGGGNSYKYGGANPLRFVDPLGLFSLGQLGQFFCSPTMITAVSGAISGAIAGAAGLNPATIIFGAVAGGIAAAATANSWPTQYPEAGEVATTAVTGGLSGASGGRRNIAGGMVGAVTGGAFQAHGVNSHVSAAIGGAAGGAADYMTSNPRNPMRAPSFRRLVLTGGGLGLLGSGAGAVYTWAANSICNSSCNDDQG